MRLKSNYAAICPATTSNFHSNEQVLACCQNVTVRIKYPQVTPCWNLQWRFFTHRSSKRAPAQIYIFTLYPGPKFTHDQIYLAPRFTHHQINPRPKFTQHQIYPQPKFTQKFTQHQICTDPNLHKNQIYTDPKLTQTQFYTKATSTHERAHLNFYTR